MYYSKCHGGIAIPGIFRFPANCHAPSVLLLLLVAEGIDGFAKGSVNFTISKLIDRLKASERFVRLVGGRRNIYGWILAFGLILGTVAEAFKPIAWWEAVTAAVLPGARGLGTVGFAESECRRLDSTRLLLLRADRFQKG
jgi:hypothetical protein